MSTLAISGSAEPPSPSHSPINTEASSSSSEAVKTIPHLTQLVVKKFFKEDSFVLTSSTSTQQDQKADLQPVKADPLSLHLLKCEARCSKQVEIIREKLRFRHPERICLFITGSDARHEKFNGKLSPIELVAYFPQKMQKEDEENLEDLNAFIDSLKDTDLVFDGDHKIEQKFPDNSFLDAFGNFWPFRFLHVEFVGGSNLVRDFFKNFVTNLKASTKYKHFIDNTLKKDAMEKLRSVLYDEHPISIKHVDITTGELFYYLTRGNYHKATKYCHMRAIQYTLDKIICDYIRNPATTEEKAIDLLMNKPNDTCALMDYLKQMGLLHLDDEEIESLKKAYILSLKYLHICQTLYTSKGDLSFTHFTLKLMEQQRIELEACFTDTYKILTKIASQKTKRH